MVNVKKNNPDFITILSLAYYWSYDKVLQQIAQTVDGIIVNEKRGEPRFALTSPIRVIVPGDGGHTIDSTLIDISGTGVRFMAPESMEAEKVVAIEVDSRLILAEVRYCQPRSGRFVVGARRLHEIAKDAQLTDAPAVVSEMLGHLRRHLAAHNAGDSQSMAVEALEQIVERREHPEAVPSPDPEPLPQPELPHQEYAVARPHSVAPPLPEPELASREPKPEPELLLQEHAHPEPHPVAPPLPQPELASPEPEPEPELLHQDHAQPEPHSVAPPPPEPELVHAQPEPQPASECALAAVPEAQVEPIAHVAVPPQHVDPLEAARRALSTDSESADGEAEITTGSSRNTRFVLALAASLILALLSGYFLYQRQSEAKPAALAPLPTPVTVAPPKLELHHAQVRLLKPTWLSLAVDGGGPSQSVLQANDMRAFDFSKGATLRVADGAAVDVSIDGNPVGPIESGPQIVHINPRGVELVK